jgi:hypothetical protein
MNANQIRLRGRLGAVLRHHPEDTETANSLRRELRVSLAEDELRLLITTPPVPTPEQRLRLVSVLKDVS